MWRLLANLITVAYPNSINSDALVSTESNGVPYVISNLSGPFRRIVCKFDLVRSRHIFWAQF